MNLELLLRDVEAKGYLEIELFYRQMVAVIVP